jgi:hypothetical protein
VVTVRQPYKFIKTYQTGNLKTVNFMMGKSTPISCLFLFCSIKDQTQSLGMGGNIQKPQAGGL